MTGVHPSPLPPGALLGKYAENGGFTDCFTTEVDAAISHADFIRAFYTTPLFKIERKLLQWFAAKPSTDADADALAAGIANTFSAWRVEGRTESEILLADLTGRTRSWLMVRALHSDREARTRLYFGSAVVPRRDARTGRLSLGIVFTLLLGFHRLYSRLLLRAAHNRLLTGPHRR